MAEDGVSTPDVLSRFTRARGTGEAAGGLIRVEVDGTGDITDLVIESRAMRLASEDLADALRAAFRAARGAVRESMREAAAPEAPEEMQSTLAQLGLATRRLDEMTSLAQELSDRLDRLT